MEDNDPSWLKKYIINKNLLLLLAEAFLPLLVTYSMFILSDEGKNLYDRLTLQLKGEHPDIPLGVSGWFTAIALPISAVIWIWVIINKYLEGIHKEDISEYKSKLNFYTSNIQTLIDGLLYSFAMELKLVNSDRATIYVRVATTNATYDYEFIPIARYAGNPEFRQKGRSCYPSDQGIISKAWQNGHHFDNKIPKSEDKDLYNTYHFDRYGISEQVASRIKMKSRLYYGWRIKDSSGKDDIAVIIVESTSKTRFTEAVLTAFFDKRKRFLREFVTHIRPMLPSSIGTQRGF